MPVKCESDLFRTGGRGFVEIGNFETVFAVIKIIYNIHVRETGKY